MTDAAVLTADSRGSQSPAAQNTDTLKSAPISECNNQFTV